MHILPSGPPRVYSTEVGTIEHLATREVGGWSQHYCPIASYRDFTYSSLVNSSHGKRQSRLLIGKPSERGIALLTIYSLIL